MDELVDGVNKRLEMRNFQFCVNKEEQDGWGNAGRKLELRVRAGQASGLRQNR